MKKRYSIVIIILCGLMISSCSGYSDTNNNSESSANNTEIKSGTKETTIEDGIPNYLKLSADFEGQSFRVLGSQNDTYNQFTTFEVFAEKENGDIINDAVFRRNTIIEDKYNVKIEQTLVKDTNKSSTELLQVLTQNIMAGDDSHELFFIALRDVGAVITKGYSLNLYDLPYIDFSEPYWNQNTNRSVTIANKLYLTNSDFSLVDKKRTYTLIYNRDMLKTYSKYNLEDLVRSGSWTFDILTELCEQVSADLNGDGVTDNNDQWGVGMDSLDAVNAFGTGMNGLLATKDENDLPVLNLLDERMINIAGMLYETFNENKTNGFYSSQYKNWIHDSTPASLFGDMFKRGQVLFITAFPQSLPGLSADAEIDYGIITWPKYDENQDEYVTFADGWGSVLFGVPYISQNTELAGFMLEVLSGYSTDTTLEAYYEVSCKVKYTYDETSAEMLDLIFSGITFDLGSMYNWASIYSKTLRTVLTSTSNTYVSNCEKIMESAKAEMQNTIDAVINRK